MKRKPNMRAEAKLGASRRVSHHRSRAGDVSGNTYLELEIRIRGEVGYLYRETCAGLEDAARIGRMQFVAFDARNPWLVQDSLQRRIFVLLDPETETLRKQHVKKAGQRSRRTNGSAGDCTIV
jgi:hypothetical protein